MKLGQAKSVSRKHPPGKEGIIVRIRLLVNGCLEDINNFWMAHKPQTMSELYSHLHEEQQLRLDEALRVGYGFVLQAPNVSVVPNVPKLHQNGAVENAA